MNITDQSIKAKEGRNREDKQFDEPPDTVRWISMRQEIKEEVARRLRPREHINKTLDTLFKYSAVFKQEQEEEEQKKKTIELEEQKQLKPQLPQTLKENIKHGESHLLDETISQKTQKAVVDPSLDSNPYTEQEERLNKRELLKQRLERSRHLNEQTLGSEFSGVTGTNLSVFSELRAQESTKKYL